MAYNAKVSYGEQPSMQILQPVGYAVPGVATTQVNVQAPGGYGTGMKCPKCNYHGRHHLRVIHGNVSRCWYTFMYFFCSMYLAVCCPRMYDNLMVCGSCGAEINRSQASCCDIC